MIRRLGLLAAVAAALVLAVAGEAAAVTGGSIAFARDHNIWLTSPDGATQRPLTTDGTAAMPYYSPTQSGDGSVIVAVRIRDIDGSSGAVSSLYEMDRQGTLWRAPFDPPQVAFVYWGPDKPCPGYFRIPRGVRSAVSPDAGKIAVVMFADFYLPPACGGPYYGTSTEVYVLDGSTASAVIAPGPNAGPLSLASPFWATNSQLLMSAGPGGVEYYDLGAAHTETWASSGDLGFPTRSPSLGGGRLATTSFTRVRLWSTTGPVPAAPTARCDIYNPDHPAYYYDSNFRMASGAMAPDGAGVVWVEQDLDDGGTLTASRIFVSPVGDISVGDCGSLDRQLLVADGSDPNWGAAAVGPPGSSPTLPVCPAGQPGTPPACGNPPATCPPGQTGTPPACSAPPQQPPAVVPPAVVPPVLPSAVAPPASRGVTSSRPATRIVRVVVKLRSGCSRNQLSVSGRGVKVIAAKRLPRSRCRVTLRVSAGVKGRRNLRVTARGRTTKRAVIRL